MTIRISSITQTMRSTTLVLATAILMACSGDSVVAQEVDASKYKAVNSPFKVSTGDKIEVIELFWFGCGHCYSLEPHVKNWKKNIPANASFTKVPALFSKRWEFHGQAFYTMQSLGVPQEAYDGFFESIHVQRKPINTLPQFISFLAKFDKSEELVTSTFNSFEIDSKMRNARKITKESGATGVPAIVVDGKFLTSEQLAGRGPNMFNVVNQLIEKAAAER